MILMIYFAIIKIKTTFALATTGCSSVRFRVHVWGAWGRKFESCHPDHISKGVR